MKSERWSHIEEIFHGALQVGLADRETFLTDACAADTNLREEVQSLISAYELPGDFLEQSQLSTGLSVIAARDSQTLAGEIIGPYKLDSRIGSGGMGDVYLARDQRLGRQLALKVLPTSMGSDSEWIERFQQEARAASSISHPNIAHIYEVGEFTGRHYIAMEYIEGITLRERLRRGSVSFDEAIEITLQVARGLAAAHAVGVLHRDVKPENIMIRFDGYVKVLDFGLAKIDLESDNIRREDFVADLNETEPGVIRGTTRYMSPEQARGFKSDARTDIWSLGVALYEMLCGEPPFTGETSSDVLAEILKSDPRRLTGEDSHLSPASKTILRRALTKDRESRYQSVNELLQDLQTQDQTRHGSVTGIADSWSGDQVEGLADKKTDEMAALGVEGAVIPKRRALQLFDVSKRIRRLSAIAVVTILLLAVSLAYMRFEPTSWSGQTPARGEKKVMSLTLNGKSGGGELSPDGRYLAYGSMDTAGLWSVWLRDLTDNSESRVLPPNEKVYAGLVFSQDGKSLYFNGSFGTNMNDFLQGPLHKMLLSTREVKKVTIGVNSAITLSPDGKRMAFIRRNTSLKDTALIVAKEDGSDEQTLATVKWPTVFYFPNWSRDGKLLALGQRSLDAEGYYANAIAIHVDSGEIETLTSQRWSQLVAVKWLADGSGILAMAVDRQGEPMQVWEISYPSGHAHNITDDTNDYVYHALSLSADSSKMLITRNTINSSMWVTQENRSDIAHQLSSSNGDGFNGISWTPEGTILYTSRSPDKWDLWEVDPAGGKPTRLTINAGNNYYPSASSDGRHIVFASDRGGPFNVWKMDRDGNNLVRLTHGSFDDFPYFTPDGNWVIYRSTDRNNRRLWKVSTQGGEPAPLTDKYTYPPALSSDGKLIASFYSLGALRGLAIFPIEGGDPIKTFDILPNPGGSDSFSQVIHWTGDMRAVSYADQQKGVSNIWQQPLAGGAPQQLTHFTANQIYFFDWSGDGKQLALCRGEVESETVLVTNFR